MMGLKYFFLPILFSSPLYILGWDFGRWFAVACINYSMISLSKEVNYMQLSLEKSCRTRTVTSVEKLLLRRSHSTKSLVHLAYIPSLIALLFVLFYIRLPACCIRLAFLAEPLRSFVRDILIAAGLRTA
jgi:hypothetical protein